MLLRLDIATTPFWSDFRFFWAARLRKFVCNADHKLKKKINDSPNVSQNFAIKELLPKIAFDSVLWNRTDSGHAKRILAMQYSFISRNH